jgi:DNA ligase-1
MRLFADLYNTLDETTKTSSKVDAIAAYLAAAPPEDAVWAINFLIGRRPKRLIETRKLCGWAIEETGVPAWLFDESYQAVGDLAELIALLLPAPTRSTEKPLHYWVEERLLPLRDWDDAKRRESLIGAWREMDESQRFVWNKLITGAFRVGVSQSLVVRAVAKVSGIDANVISHRLMGDWAPTPDFIAQLLGADSSDADISRPYPFCLAYPIEGDIRQLENPHDWQVEWKWDGIRAQLIRRHWHTFLWSRGEELITERFPEIEALGALLPEGSAIDGEILAWKNAGPLPFAQMQRRIGRKVLSDKILRDVPAAIVAYDLLEDRGRDIRETPLEERRARLSEIVRAASQSGHIVLSPTVEAASWDELEALRRTSRERGVEGFMLKRFGSPYRVGRRRGDWWKWKIEPYSVDAVLIYAQPGSGKRASLFTDYTFGIWDKEELVPFAKAYSGLSDEEIRKVDAFVRRNTVEKFGPVRSVKPELVFEIAFEGIQKSPRHRSGIAVRFPRMARWRTDKKAADADSIATVKALLGPAGDVTL